jgi:hypothetical protein
VESKDLIAKWKSYTEKMQAGSVNFVHQSTKDVVQDHIEMAELFIADLQAIASQPEPSGASPELVREMQEKVMREPGLAMGNMTRRYLQVVSCEKLLHAKV